MAQFDTKQHGKQTYFVKEQDTDCYLPDLKAIAAETALIRQGWSKREKRKRNQRPATPVTIQTVMDGNLCQSGTNRRTDLHERI